VNAYESLKRAAERVGAPLCGNRVWAVGGNVFAQRDSTTIEQLATVGGSLRETLVHHGGRRIDLKGDNGERPTLAYTNGSWMRVADSISLPPGLPGGTAHSFFAISHGFDSATVLQPSGGGPDIDVGIFDVYSGMTTPLTTIPVVLPPPSSTTTCIWQISQFHPDSVGVFTGYRCIDSIPTGSVHSAGSNASFSPFSDSVYIAVSLTRSTTTSSPGFSPCPWSTVQFGHDTDLCVASYTSTTQSLGTTLYAIPKRQNTTASVLPWSLLKGVVSMGLSEDGTEAVFDTFVNSSTTTFTPQTLSPGGNGFFTSDFQSSESCAYEYWDILSGQLRRTVDQQGECTFTAGGGTISPLRAGLAGQ